MFLLDFVETSFNVQTVEGENTTEGVQDQA